MQTYRFVVTVEAEDYEDAETVIRERIGPDEDYGFYYRISFAGVPDHLTDALDTEGL
jgi:hypothetical protein